MTNISLYQSRQSLLSCIVRLLRVLRLSFADQPNNVELALPKNLVLLDFKILIKTILCLILWFPLSFFHSEFAGLRETAKNLGLGDMIEVQLQNCNSKEG